MGGFASILGLLLQVGLIIIVACLAFAWWQRRNAPSVAMQPAGPALGIRSERAGVRRFRFDVRRQRAGRAGRYAGHAREGRFRRLREAAWRRSTSHYSAEDLSALRGKATPEMVSYFAEELADNASRGVINRVTDVKLLQGDLAEAWREGGHEYATVAMHFGLTDTTVDPRQRQGR